MENKSHKYYKRGFLNKDEGMAAFSCDVSVDAEDYPYLHASLTVTDCNRSVCLDFNCSSLECIENAKHKIDVLISELVHFKEEFLQGAKFLENSRGGNKDEMAK